MRWHCKIGGVRRGPLSTLELKWLATDGELRPTDLVKRDGDPAWTRASRVRGLFPSIDPASADGGAAEGEPEQLSAAVASVPKLSDSESVSGGGDAASGSNTAGRKFKLSARDTVGLVALGLSAVLLVGAVWFAFGGSSGELSLESTYTVVETPPSTATVNDRTSPAAPRSEPPPPVVTRTVDDAVLDDLNPTSAGAWLGTQGPETVVALPAPAVVPKAPVDSSRDSQPLDSTLEASSDAAAQPAWPVQPADFQVAPDEVAEAEGPFPANLGATTPAIPAPLLAAEAAVPANNPVPPDPRDDVHLEKVQQLHTQTRGVLTELRTAQDAVVAVRNEIQLAQGELNRSTVLLAQLSVRWGVISDQLGARGIPLEQRRLLRQELANTEQQSAALQMTRKNQEMNLSMGLPRKLKVAEHAVVEVIRKCDATIPAWIELADPYGAQSQVAHQRVAEACSAWLVGESIFAPGYLMRGFASWHVADLDRATEDFDQAVQQSEGNTQTANQQDLLAVALSARAVLHAQRNQEAQAKADTARAAELCPRSVLVCIFRGRANTLLGRMRPALDDFRRATQLDDKHPDAFREFAWLLASSPAGQDGRRAVELGRIACDLTDWNQWQCLDAYALANAADGNFESAIENGRKAHDMAPFNVRPEIQQRLDLYQAGVVPQNIIHR